MEIIDLIAGPDDAGARLDAYLASALEGETRSSVQRRIEEGRVIVNGAKASKNHRLKEGDEVRVSLPPPKESAVLPQDIPLDIVYEDEALLVVDKPKGMVVHPAAGNEDGTLVNALLYHCGDSLSAIGGVIRPGIVHRIDKDTSGLLVVAKNDHAHRHLSEQIKAHTVTRRYHAVVYGRLKEEAGRIDAAIGRHHADRKKMCVTGRNAREAVTHYKAEEYLNGFTHAVLELETGRTHQIRVHMAHIGHPVAGDPVYGPKKVITGLGGQCLHARTLGFVHPGSGRYMEFSSPLPDYFTQFIHSKRGGE
jgi:23S rRNA pseudouridine1911/1915/1917 synthase